MQLSLAGDASLDLEARGTFWVHYDVVDDGAASTVTAGFFLPELCPRSAVLMALAGTLGADGAAPLRAPEVLAVPMADASGADCDAAPPFIPDEEAVADRATLPPRTEESYDLTGMGAGAFEDLVNSGAPRAASTCCSAAAAALAAATAAVALAKLSR